MRFISGLYEGELSEVTPGARWRKRHASLLLVDYRELGRLTRRLKLASVKLAPQAEIEAELQRAGLPNGGPIQALCARDVIAYLCHDVDGRLSAVRYELRRGGVWLVPADPADSMARLRATGADGLDYSVRVRRPGATVQLAVDAADGRGGFSSAVGFVGRRRKLSVLQLFKPLWRGRALARALVPALAAWSAAEPAKEQRLAA